MYREDRDWDSNFKGTLSMASISTNEQALVTNMDQLMKIYGTSGEAAQCEPILAALGSKAVSDSIAMAGASGATASMLINQEGEDFAKFGATLQADLMMTSGVPIASDAAINNELMSVLGGASSQMAPIDPNAEAEMFMAMGQGDDYDPFGGSATPTPPGTPPGTPGAYPGAPYGTSSGGGSWEVNPGLEGDLDYFALPDPPPTPWPPTPPATPPPPAVSSACPTISGAPTASG